MEKYVWAVIGYGGMGSWHAANLAKKVPAIRVKGAYDIRPEARAKAEAAGLMAYGSLQGLLDDPEVDLVTVAVPNNFHKELVIACLEHGKNTICEKPVAMNAGEAQEMLAAARRSGKLFSIHHNRRWDRDYRIVKAVVEGGEIGRPYFIESRVQGSRGAMQGWRNRKENGGGMVLDWGVHLLDQVMDLIDSPVVSVDAHLFDVFSQVEDNIKIFLRFENRVSAVLEMSTNCLIPHPRWHLSCTDGTAVIENWRCEGRMQKLRAGAQMAWEDDIVYTEAGPTRTMAPRPAYTEQELPLPHAEADWAEFYENIVQALDGKAQPMVRPEQALRVMRVLDFVFEAERAGHGIACRI